MGKKYPDYFPEFLQIAIHLIKLPAGSNP